MTTEPTVRYGGFASQDGEEITDFFRSTYADTSLRFGRVRPDSRLVARTLDVPEVGADRVRTTIDYAGTVEQGFDDFLFFTVNDGAIALEAGTMSARVGAGGSSFYPVGLPVSFEVSHFDVHALRLSADLVATRAEEVFGTPAALLRFTGLDPVSPQMGRYWRALVRLAAGALAEEDSPLAVPLLAADLARTLATAALHVFPHTAMEPARLPAPGRVLPAAVRRAVAHLEAHAAEPVTLSEVAEAAGTSARALQHAFRSHLDTTPLAMLRTIRLRRAHEDLVVGDPARGDTVAVIARRWGFGHPGRFAREYRAVHGVAPADTLRT